MTRLSMLNLEREPLQTELGRRWTAAVACHTLALLLYIIAFSTTGWTQGEYDSFHIQLGLWSACVDGQCSHLTKDIVTKLGDWIKIVQTFAVLGLILLSVQLFISLVYTISKKCGNLNSRRLIQLACVVVSVAVSFCGFSTFLFGFKMTKYVIHGPGAAGSDLFLGFSFHLGWVSCVAAVLAAGLYLLEYVSQPRIMGDYIRLE